MICDTCVRNLIGSELWCGRYTYDKIICNQYVSSKEYVKYYINDKKYKNCQNKKCKKNICPLKCENFKK